MLTKEMKLAAKRGCVRLYRIVRMIDGNFNDAGERKVPMWACDGKF